MIKVEIDEGSGFCFGVVTAIHKAEEELAKELGDEARLLLRESGTEPLIRVMVEAATDEICRENVDKIIQVLRAKGHEDKN